MYTEKMRAHLKSNWKGVAKEQQRTYLSRIRNDVRLGLEDLTLFCEKMPEDQLKQVLSEETIQPFIKALVHPQVGIWNPSLSKIEDKAERERTEKEWAARQKRIVHICTGLMHELSYASFDLAPNACFILGHGDIESQVRRLQALQIGY